MLTIFFFFFVNDKRYDKPSAAGCESYSVTFSYYRYDGLNVYNDAQINSRVSYISSPEMDGTFVKGTYYYVQTQSTSIWGCNDPAPFPYKAADATKYGFVY